MSDLFTQAEESRAARDAGLFQVQSNNLDWFALAMIELEEIAKHGSRHWANIETFTGETIRLMLAPMVGQPGSPNAWGSLIMHAVRKKLIEPTGQYVSMKLERSHARKTPVYRWAR
ncbi:MAG: hypothetical protein LAP61_05550 [Acidobacteriia bacterium]|nr:hypothetical protein [Terriglobia bacterium]